MIEATLRSAYPEKSRSDRLSGWSIGKAPPKL